MRGVPVADLRTPPS